MTIKDKCDDKTFVPSSRQNIVTWMPYLSMTCIFTYILSFGMGPGKSQPPDIQYDVNVTNSMCHVTLCFARIVNKCAHFLHMVAGVTVILPTEIFNQTARPAAYMTAGFLMWLNLFIIGMIFPFLVVSALQNQLHVQYFKYNFKNKRKKLYSTTKYDNIS